MGRHALGGAQETGGAVPFSDRLNIRSVVTSGQNVCPTNGCRAEADPASTVAAPPLS